MLRKHIVQKEPSLTLKNEGEKINEIRASFLLSEQNSLNKEMPLFFPLPDCYFYALFVASLIIYFINVIVSAAIKQMCIVQMLENIHVNLRMKINLSWSNSDYTDVVGLSQVSIFFLLQPTYQL